MKNWDSGQQIKGQIINKNALKIVHPFWSHQLFPNQESPFKQFSLASWEKKSQIKMI